MNVPLTTTFLFCRSTSNRSSVQRSRREVGEEVAPPLVLVPQPMKLISSVNGYHAQQKRSSSIPGKFVIEIVVVIFIFIDIVIPL